MKKTLEVLNRLVAEKVIKDYAIGGAMGAVWYMEAISTMDSQNKLEGRFAAWNLI